MDTDVSYENGVFKGAKLHTKAGGKAFYYSFGYLFEINPITLKVREREIEREIEAKFVIINIINKVFRI